MYIHIANHIELDREQRSVRKNGQIVHLTVLEYGLLEFLSAHPNRICSRQEAKFKKIVVPLPPFLFIKRYITR